MLKLVKWGGAAALVVVVAAVAGWYFVLRSEAEPRARIEETPTVPTVAGGSGADGTYAITVGGKSFAGYRVTEKLIASAVRTDATGRTSNVQATFRVAGTTVDGVTITVDMTTLRSDNSMRDGRLRDSGIEYGRFPTSKFVLTAPITLPSAPTAGATVKLSATGDLTLHGVTKSVTIPLEARWDGAEIQVVGSLPVVFSDYGIRAPTSSLVASVDDHGELEFQLFFAKS